MISNDRVSIVCVLKREGVYNRRAVKDLHGMIEKYLTVPYEFVCLTDIVAPFSKPLLSNYYKWWSKIESFRITGAVIYFDLDTAIFQSLDSIAKNLLNGKNKGLNVMYMLHTFKNSFKNTGDWSSGFMAWTGDFRWLYNEFNEDEDIEKYQWEQKYIIDKLEKRGIPILSIQGLVKGKITGYKHFTMSEKDIKMMNVTVACFHNKP